MDFIALLALFGGSIYLLLRATKWVANWRHPYGKLIVGAVAVLVSWFIFRAVYPSESFYRADFEREAGFGLPEGARLIAGNASFPDHFGDYCSAAVFEFNAEDWESLPKDLEPPLGDAAGSHGSSCKSAVGSHIPGPLDPSTATYKEGGAFFSWGKHEPSRRLAFHYSSW